MCGRLIRNMNNINTGLTGSLFYTTVQQALRVKWGVFGVFVCFGLYFVNYRSWQAEILQERAEGCIQVDLQKKIAFLFCGFVGVVFGNKFKIFFRHFI